uniref:ELM2 domain-containing protein n=1 Tax=Parastrongyloides trichosuri TaxID=131310 RepID=A0A0N5A3X7_PARTI
MGPQSRNGEPPLKKKKLIDRTFFEELQIRRSTRLQHIPEESEFSWLSSKNNNNNCKVEYVPRLKVGPEHQAVIPECRKGNKSAPTKTTEILIWDYKQDNADKWTLEKQAMVHEFADAVEDYGYDYLEALNILRLYDCDPVESSRHVEAYIPHHSFKPFTPAEERLLKNCKKKADKPQKKQQVFQQMVAESKRTHKEIVEHYRRTKKHTCETTGSRRKKCWCKERLIIKPIRNKTKREDCKNCSDRLYLNDNVDFKLYKDNDAFPLCSLCKYYFKYTNKMRKPVVEFDPNQNKKMRTNQEVAGEMEKIDIPESHIPLILSEIGVHSLDIEGIVTGLKENHGIVAYTHGNIRWFITTQAHKYNIRFNNGISEGHIKEGGNLEKEEVGDRN